jgi:hypothetical protein
MTVYKAFVVVIWRDLPQEARAINHLDTVIARKIRTFLLKFEPARAYNPLALTK